MRGPALALGMTHAISPTNRADFRACVFATVLSAISRSRRDFHRAELPAPSIHETRRGACIAALPIIPGESYHRRQIDHRQAPQGSIAQLHLPKLRLQFHHSSGHSLRWKFPHRSNAQRLDNPCVRNRHGRKSRTAAAAAGAATAGEASAEAGAGTTR